MAAQLRLPRRASRRWNHGADPGAQERRWLRGYLTFFAVAVVLAALIILASH